MLVHRGAGQVPAQRGKVRASARVVW
jgi:hypothetical protein